MYIVLIVKMPRLWAFCLLLASAKAVPTSHVNQSCRLSTESPCSESINSRHIEQMERYMRPEVDPCHDFHGYACGNWRTLHGNDVSAMSLSGSRIDQRYVDLFERLLSDPLAKEHQLPMYDKLLRYYQSCRGLGQKSRLHRYLEQLPHSARNSHWLDQLAVLARYGYHDHFVQLQVSHHNATQHMVLIQRHNYNLSLNLSMPIYRELRRQMHDVNQTLRLRHQFAHLEQTLQRISRPAPQQEDVETLRSYTLQELQQQLPEVNWTRTLELQLGVVYDESHQLLVDDVPTLRNLIRFLNRSDARLMRLYSMARFLQHLLLLPHNPIHASGSSNHIDNSPVGCVRHMRKTLYLAMNYAYEQSYYAPQRDTDERIIYGVFEELKTQFSRRLQRNEFGVNEELLESLQQKVHGLRLNVGNMPRGATIEFFVDCTRHWHVTDDFYGNHLHSLLHFYSHLAELERSENATLRQLFYSFNHHEPWLGDNIDATPYFYCLGSMIIMPYAYVQLPFYHAHFWPALLYGDLANTLGHEMSHAFDTYFVDYDAQGVMRDYSDQLQSNAAYAASVRCMNDSQVIVLNERAADISGTRLALDTYLQHGEQRRHNGRLYFLQFAQFFCGEEADRYHDDGSKRLNYTLAQMPEFAEVFHCAPGTPMNPVERCGFW